MKKFLLKLLMGTSLTASVFVFQACYAPGPEDYNDSIVEEALQATQNSTEIAAGEEPGADFVEEDSPEEEQTPV